MKQPDSNEIVQEMQRTRGELMSYFEVLPTPEQWAKARKKLLDAFSENDGMIYRVKKQLGLSKGKETNNGTNERTENSSET